MSISFFIYLATSIVFKIADLSWEPFDRINLISTIFPGKEVVQSGTSPNKENPNLITKEKPEEDFQLYMQPELITNFYKGDSVALPHFTAKLKQLQEGKNVKIRIAYFGDSMIEGDLLTQTLRKYLQQTYGGFGVGFLPLTSSVAGFRQTATVPKSGWNDINFKTKGATNMYFSGHYYTGAGTGKYTDNTLARDTMSTPIQKSLLYGKATAPSEVNVGGRTITLSQSNLVNRQVLENNSSHQIQISTHASSVPYYGVSFESESGIILDNFSFRGITGVELNKLNVDFLKAIQAANHYDLIVFQYGVNLLFRPKDTDYSYYAKLMTPVLEKFKESFPDADVLMVSSADRAFRYEGEYKTAIGLPNLIETQAKLAFDNGFAFYNQFQSMGGENSIVKWANEKPALANKDYVHPNSKGADVLAEKLFHAIQNDYKTLLKNKKNAGSGK